jgi:YhcH/YjgK/YiaL family protein
LIRHDTKGLTMIFDRIENAATYRGANPRLAAALEYLARTDFSQVAEGKHELDGQNMFANVQHYPSRPMEEIAWEAHRKYFDVQYIASGAEKMGHINLHDGLTSSNLTVKTPYDAEKDAEFYNAKGHFVIVRAGDFTVFFPQDVHAPCLSVGPSPEDVLKVVVKCRMA